MLRVPRKSMADIQFMYFPIKYGDFVPCHIIGVGTTLGTTKAATAQTEKHPIALL